MSFLEKWFSGKKKETVQDIESAIDIIRKQIEQKENEFKLLQEKIQNNQLPSSPINKNNLGSLGIEARGLKEKLIFLEEKRRHEEQRQVENLDQLKE